MIQNVTSAAKKDVLCRFAEALFAQLDAHGYPGPPWRECSKEEQDEFLAICAPALAAIGPRDVAILWYAHAFDGGEFVDFPEQQQPGADVVILPVVRIERFGEATSQGKSCEVVQLRGRT